MSDFEDQLFEFMDFLRMVYDGSNIITPSSAIVCDAGCTARRKDGCYVFYENNNPIDKLICTAVEWTLEHVNVDDYYRNDAYIAWFAVRTILMVGFKRVNISHIEKQYWSNPEEFSKCFNMCDRTTCCWWKVKMYLGKIKYVIDMWYDEKNYFGCRKHKRSKYTQWKNYYVDHMELLPFSIEKQTYQHAMNYEKHYAKNVIDDCCSGEEYNEDCKDSDIDGREEEHIAAEEEARKQRLYVWEHKYIIANLDDCISDSNDSYGGVD